MSEELKACPWCGSKAEEDEFFSDGIAVRAVSCSGYNDHCDYGYLLKDWQSRPIEDALLTRIAELELRLDAYNGNLLDVLQAENARLREEVERLSRQTGDK